MWKWCFVSFVTACGDNRGPPDARPDAKLLPDLTLLGDEMLPTIDIVTRPFVATDCEVVEQCTVPGLRTLLRFDTVTANLGNADLVVGRPPPDGISNDVFEWSPCHGHHHVAGYATYELLDGTGIAAAGHKQSFCLHDVQAVRPTLGNNYNCVNQGMSAGWADVYSRNLPCQWIDITGLTGTYTLRVEVNAARKLEESDTTNNAWSTTVRF